MQFILEKKRVCNNLHVTAQESLTYLFICKSNVNARRDSVDLRCTEIKCFSFAFSIRYFYSRFQLEAKLSLNSKRTIGELFIREAFSVNESSRLLYKAGSAVSSACPLPPTTLWLMPNNYRYFTHSFLLYAFFVRSFYSLSFLSSERTLKTQSTPFIDSVGNSFFEFCVFLLLLVCAVSRRILKIICNNVFDVRHENDHPVKCSQDTTTICS